MTVINSNRAVRGPVTAVPLVAGKGVKITADTVNNRFVAEVDETVLFSSDSGVNTSTQVVLSEAYTNFEFIRFEYLPWNETQSEQAQSFGTKYPNFCLNSGWTSTNGAWFALFITNYQASDTTHLSVTKCGYSNCDQTSTWATSNANFKLFKVVGINRIASN